jgi:hypothetical protein
MTDETKTDATPDTGMVMVNMHVRNWKGEKTLKNVTREVNTKYGVKNKRGSYKVGLLPDKYKKPLTTGESKLREFYYERTVPWADGGWRAIPADAVEKFLTDFDVLKVDFEMSVTAMLTHVDEINALNAVELKDIGMKDGVILTPMELQTKYDCSTEWGEITDPDRLAHGLPDAVSKSVHAQALKDLNDRTQGATADLLDRVYTLAGDLITRAEGDGNNKWGGFAKVIARVADAVEGLNFADDDKVKDGVSLLKGIDFTDMEDAKRKACQILGRTYKAEEQKAVADVFGDACDDIVDEAQTEEYQSNEITKAVLKQVEKKKAVKKKQTISEEEWAEDIW